MTAHEIAPTPEEKRRSLEEVLQSTTFARADQLKRFLRYICDMEIAGRAAEISEYSIGTEALGRPPGYSPGDDSTVRSRAHALRQKLEEFYENEGAATPLRIELRKGSYTPHYLDGPASRQAKAPAPVPAASQISRTKIIAASGVLVVLLAAIFGALVYRGAPAPEVDPVLARFWGPLLRSDEEVLLCVATAPSMLLKSFRPGTVPDEPRLLPAPPEVSEWYAGLQMLDGGGKLYSQTSTNANLFGDTIAAITAARTLTKAGSPFQILPEYSVRPLAFRGRNVLLIGSPNYSPHAARVLRESPFTVRWDADRKEEMIAENVAPDKGPGAVYFPKRDELGRLTEAYGIVTVLPSPARGEGVERTVIFSGITSAGTQAAMEFFASPASLRDLESHFHTTGLKDIPPAYQVIVKCQLDRLLALDHAYETHRIIQRPAFAE